MDPPVHSSAFFARDVFFTGRRDARRPCGASGSAPRRRAERGAGTSVPRARDG
ncbi:hypothetical protein GCM10010360_43170 [Streptomyces nogalater]